jgi:uncharacterized protein YuzE
MRIQLDKESDTLYFRLKEDAIVESEEVQPGLVLDFDSAGQVVGVEFLKVSSRADECELKNFQFQAT